MRLHLSVPVAVIGLSLFLSATAQAASYTFTKIADNSNNLSSFLNAPRPSINNKGTVAFVAGLREGGNGVFIGNGESITTIAIGNRFFSLFGTSINDNDVVTFPLFQLRPEQSSVFIGLFTGNGEELTPIIDNIDSYKTVTFPSINNEGTVAFGGRLPDDSANLFTSRGNTLATMTDSSTFNSFESVSINNEGTIAFQASNMSGRSTIFTSNGESLTTIATTDPAINSEPFRSLSGVSINDRGTVVFQASLLPRGRDQLILTSSSDGTLTTVTEASLDGGKPFLAFEQSTASINNNGNITFLGRPVGQTSGIFTGSDPVTDKVIAVGDPLFDSSVLSISLGQDALNDVGQIAFVVQLYNGTQAVVRANPTP